MPTVAEIAGAIQRELAGTVEVHGDPGTAITGLGAIHNAAPGQITHLSGSAYRRYLPATRASAVLLRAGDADACPATAVVVGNPYLAFAAVSQLFDDAPRLAAGVNESAHVDPDASVHPGAAVGAGATVSAGAVIRNRAEIGAGAFVGAATTVGEHTIVHPNATLCHGVRIGDRCVVHAGAVIGADGFGFTPDERGRLRAIAQTGGVTIGNDVSIGACTTIDRGTIDDTVIRDGVKIDNQVQIGHNCDIGEHTLICGCVGIVGSTKIGRHCAFAGGSGVGGAQPIEICDHVQVSVVSTVTRSITEPGIYSSGTLHDTARRWKRNAVRFGQLDGIARRLARLERERGQGG